jgi:hypothetical protein
MISCNAKKDTPVLSKEETSDYFRDYFRFDSPSYLDFERDEKGTPVRSKEETTDYPYLYDIEGKKIIGNIQNDIPMRAKKPSDFISSSYRLFDKIEGDLNNDGLTDCVMIIKGTNTENWTPDEWGKKKVDRNRRGIIIIFNKGDHFELALKNLNCFSSENEYGGVYMPPRLSVNIENGNLYIGYYHGRYGWWQYTFRLQNSDFELIGYDSESGRNSMLEQKTSINYLTKRREEINKGAMYKVTWDDILVEDNIKLSKVINFDGLDVSGVTSASEQFFMDIAESLKNALTEE